MDLEDRILSLARDEGLLSEADQREAEEALADISWIQTSIWGPRVAWLVEVGRIPRAQAHRLLAKAIQGETLPQEETPSWSLPEEITQVHGERFELLEPLGMGGQGRVYRARDLVLQREVALKFIHWDSPRPADELLEEARAQALVNHPNVCKVFEAGYLHGQPFIALQIVEGPPFRDAMASLDPEGRIRMLIQIAEGIHAAHEAGLVHLDLKPANILVEPLLEGGFHPVVTDFGLVLREGRNAVWVGMGTAPFASPEQRSGDPASVDRRSDVYSLGVLLHLAVTGEAPNRTATGEVAADLLAIIQTSMAPLRDQRYPTALGMAEDLRRYLGHFPLRRGPSSLTHRGKLWARRHRWVALLLASGLPLLVGMAGWNFAASSRAKAHARVVHHFGEEARDLANFLQLAHISPLHDRRPEMAEARRRMALIRGEMARLGPEVQGSGHLALGMAHFSLGEMEEAIPHLERGYEAGYRDAALLQNLANARMRLALRHLKSLRELGPKAPEGIRAAFWTEWGEPALLAIRRSGSGKALETAAEAVLEGRVDQAQAQALIAETEGEALPWYYQRWCLLYDLWENCYSQGLRTRGPSAQAREHATLMVRKTLDIARSDPRIHCDEGNWCLLLATGAQGEGKDPLPHLEAAERAFRRAQESDPDFAWAHRRCSDAARRIALTRWERGEDPRAALGRAHEAAENHLRLLPDSPESWVVALRAHSAELAWALAQGRSDPGLASPARTALEASIRRFPKSATLRIEAAALARQEADLAIRTDGKTKNHLDESRREARLAEELSPGALWPVEFQVGLEAHTGELMLLLGEDPQPSVRAALDRAEGCVAAGSPPSGIAPEMAQVRLLEARIRLARGMSPREPLRLARQALEQIRPDGWDAESLVAQLEARVLETLWEEYSGTRPKGRPELLRALKEAPRLEAREFLLALAQPPGALREQAGANLLRQRPWLHRAWEGLQLPANSRSSLSASRNSSDSRGPQAR